MNYKNIFLKQSENLLNELSEILPGSGNIELYKEKFYLIRKANSNIIVNSFIKYVLIHKENILKKNEEFFLNGGGQEKVSNDNQHYVLSLKSDWNNISEENKNIIWKYFHVLILLAEKIVIEVMSK